MRENGIQEQGGPKPRPAPYGWKYAPVFFAALTVLLSGFNWLRIPLIGAAGARGEYSLLGLFSAAEKIRDILAGKTGAALTFAAKRAFDGDYIMPAALAAFAFALLYVVLLLVFCGAALASGKPQRKLGVCAFSCSIIFAALFIVISVALNWEVRFEAGGFLNDVFEITAVPALVILSGISGIFALQKAPDGRPRDKGFSEWFREFIKFKGILNIRTVCITGMMIAVAVVLDRFTIQPTPDFKFLSVSYIPGAIVAMLFGPWVAVIYGFLWDTVKFAIDSRGSAYFFGYALSEMVCCFIYACFLYKQNFRVWKVVAARALITLVVILGMNHIWNNMLWGQTAGTFYTSARLVNNLVQFPLHAAVIVLIGKYFRKIPYLRKLAL